MPYVSVKGVDIHYRVDGPAASADGAAGGCRGRCGRGLRVRCAVARAVEFAR